MRPSSIPDAENWGHRIVISAPDGDLLNPDIAPVEVIADEHGLNIRLVPDPGDLERMAAGVPLWLTLYTHRLPMFSVCVPVDDVAGDHPGWSTRLSSADSATFEVLCGDAVVGTFMWTAPIPHPTIAAHAMAAGLTAAGIEGPPAPPSPPPA